MGKQDEQIQENGPSMKWVNSFGMCLPYGIINY